MKLPDTPASRIEPAAPRLQDPGSGLALVFLSDDNFARALAVAMYSTLEHLSRRIEPEIYILDNGIAGASKKRVLKVADAGGTIWTASDEIPAGAEATLTMQSGRSARLEPNALRELYRGDWTKLITTRKPFVDKALAPGRYIATIEGSPFMQDGLSDTQVRPGNSIVIGIMKRDENGS